ncbi:leucyl aminopeptidase [Falsirhodobacter halotolerans]|uniref:leucyl aminopeptidase n=1 Tax=Falsirhodobacter halotolerans TaxID=1146892 RepID=UPI001FD0BEAB|nr:leucyl aminopeptidase [Falsirhodobacter halotolerans]MCJ8139762.1 leucyl aminopeptidase [Falsirhodobacter halotolerans]
MTVPVTIEFLETDLDRIEDATGQVAIFLGQGGKMGAAATRVDALTSGTLSRVAASEAFGKLKPGEGMELSYPAGLAADMLHVIRLDRADDVAATRKAGAAIGRKLGAAGATVLADAVGHAAEVAFGLTLRAYRFDARKTGPKEAFGPVTMMVAGAEAVRAEAAPLAALADGVFMTRDLVNEPANVLTTTEFAARLEAMRDLGLTVEVLEEDALADLGMGALLGVGQGSASPSKVVVMQWNGGGEEPPFALVGKGVVFDTGGISIKPAGGMEDMTMDMGGAGTVAGVMRALAGRKAAANVVGIVGLVENMPDGLAQRPGDIVTSMKGDTIEVINTDAEGRLVLADIMWYVQDRFQPTGMIDLATLTGAIIVALGHENTGVFANDDALCDAFLAAAAAEGEGAWRLPMGDAYDARLKSRVADMRNVGTGRDGGSIVAAQFLQRFVKDGTPWVHLDIAGTALLQGDSAFAPGGATGWGVLALNRLIRDRFEV